MERVEILGVQIDNVSGEEALARIREMIQSRAPHQIVTPAIEQVICARRDPEFSRALREADLVLPDGMQVVIASRLHQTPLKERITGVDMVPRICRLAASEGYSVFFMGGEPGIAEEAARALQAAIPGLPVAGTYCPPLGFERNPVEQQKALQAVREARPDVLFLALGAPRQEKWIHRWKRELGVPVMVGVGGAFNFITGREKRAPVWLQNLGMEGLYRLFQRPRDLWKRVIINAPYFFLLLFDRLSYRRQKQILLASRPLILGLTDAILSPLTFLFSYWLYFRSGIFSNTADPFADVPTLLEMPAYSDLLIFVSLLSVPALWARGLYLRDKYQTFSSLLRKIAVSTPAVVFLLIGFQFAFKDIFREYRFHGFSRVVFAFFGVSFFTVLLAWRWLFQITEQALHRRGMNLDRIMIVGASRTAHEIASAMKTHPELGNLPIGYITWNPAENSKARTAGDTEEEIPVLGNLEDLKRLLPARKVDEILIADSSLSLNDLKKIVRLCRKNQVGISIVPTLHELLGVSSEIKRLGDYRVIYVRPDRELDRLLARNPEEAE